MASVASSPPSQPRPASQVLAKDNQLRGMSVIELGAGPGLAGCAAALHGADVLLTDRNPTHDLVTCAAAEANAANAKERKGR